VNSEIWNSEKWNSEKPSASSESQIGVTFAEDGQRGGHETILLVEDEAFVRKVTAEVLESAGYRLVLARNGAEALQACRQRSQMFDLLLADLVMPGMSGHELELEFRISCPSAGVLLMTGYPEQMARCESSDHDQGYLAKPFSTHTLLAAVHRVLKTNQSWRKPNSHWICDTEWLA